MLDSQAAQLFREIYIWGFLDEELLPEYYKWDTSEDRVCALVFDNPLEGKWVGTKGKKKNANKKKI